MSRKELIALRKALKEQQKEVKISKGAAIKLLTEIGVLNVKGQLTQPYKPVNVFC